MSSNIHDSTIENAVAYQLHRTNRLLLTHLGRFLETHHSELTPETYFIVMKLYETGSLAQNELVEVALEDGPNVSRLVERLVKTGLVERREHPNDRRARLLELTAEGKSLAERVKSDQPGAREALFAGITESEIETVRSVLDRLNENARPMLLKEEAT